MANPEMWNGSFLKGERKKKAGRSPLKTKPEKTQHRDSFLWGIMADRLHQQEKQPSFEEYRYTCEKCGCKVGDTFEEAMTNARPCHIAARKKNPKHFRYSKRWDLGSDHPSNIYAGCDQCNEDDYWSEAAHPQWTTN